MKLSVSLFLSILVCPIAAAATSCGGDGERACCVASDERVTANGCNAGNIEQPKCGPDTGQSDCKCGGSGLAVFFGSSSSSHCAAVAHCGENGERACCLSDDRFPDNPIPLSAGCRGTADGGVANLTEIAGGVPGTGVCGGSNLLGLKSNGHCVPCGTEGAHACVGGGIPDTEGCGPGLSKGAFGLCSACGGDGQQLCRADVEDFMCNPGFHPAAGVCREDRKIAEPDCNCDAVPPAGDPAAPVRGYADLHLHMFANLGFGGVTVWGDAFDKRGGIGQALRGDNYAQRTADYVLNGHIRQGINNDVVPIDLFRKQQLVHGDFHANDIIGAGNYQQCCFGLPGLPSLSNTGVQWDENLIENNFVGWPKWNSVTHQQAYYGWLNRAHRGGLRLVVMLAVTNETLCVSGRHLDYPEFDCKDTSQSIKLQLAKAIEMEDWLDSECRQARSIYDQLSSLGSLTSSQQVQLTEETARMERSCAARSLPPTLAAPAGWFKIARSPQEAREAIAGGQLAVVLGIEEANLFGCNSGTCGLPYIKEQLDIFHDLGVRHIFPIHNFDNDYGGAATWMDTIAVGNRYATGKWYATENCPDASAAVGDDSGYGTKLAPGFSDWLAGLILDTHGVFQGLDTPDYYPDLTTSCNQKGLTPLGSRLVEAMMRKGMIIDVDHMSIKALDATLTLAEANSYPGIVASHALLFDLTKKDFRHERMRTTGQLKRIAALGGMIGAMTQPPEGAGAGEGTPVTIQEWPGSNVDNDCQASSKTWAQMYEFVTGTVPLDGGKKWPVAFGTDFNGISRHNAPRFGIDACDGQVRAGTDADKVSYPFTIDGFGTFDKQETGGRTFDFNDDGLAHVGLLPDMIADLKQVGLGNDGDLDPLFQSAEYYLQMWEKSLVAAATIPRGPDDDDVAPTVTATPASPANGSGWNKGPGFFVKFDAQDNPGGAGVKGVFVFLVGPQYPPFDLRRSDEATLDVTVKEGKTQLFYTAADLNGNVRDLQTIDVWLDSTPPTIDGTASPPPSNPAASPPWNKEDVTVAFACSDALSGVASCPTPVVVSIEGAGLSVTAYASDLAGNSNGATVGNINIDKTAPGINGNVVPAPNAAGWNRTNVSAHFECTDAVSGVASCGPDVMLTSEGTGQSAAGNAVDAAGNASSATVENVNIDKTAPVIALTSPAQDAAFVLGEAVPADWSASDALSGIASASGTTATGSLIDTASAGAKSFTVTAIDVAGNAVSVTHGYKVLSPPDLVIAKSHPGAFAQGDAADNYTITVTNIGEVATSGTVTVVDTLPVGLTGTALAGTDWACTLATLTCTRDDPLLPASSYPPILLTVAVATTAPASVTNTATVSGGGDADAGNNFASDPTVIAQRNFSGTSAGEGGGTATASFTTADGGAGCGFSSAAFVPLSSVATPAPSRLVFPGGLFDFEVSGCAPGFTMQLTLTYPNPLQLGTSYWKFGPRPGYPAPAWYELPASINGNSVTITITDGALGDDDFALGANGTIVDPGGAARFDPILVPALRDGIVWALVLLLGLLGVLHLRPSTRGRLLRAVKLPLGRYA